MKNSTSIYTHWAPSLKKFLNKVPIYTLWSMFTHVWTMSALKNELIVNLNLIKGELKVY